MRCRSRLITMPFIVSVACVGLGAGHAEEPFHPASHSHGYTHSGSYSPLHYCAPTLWRLKMWRSGEQIGMYPPDRHPEIPPRYRLMSFPSPGDCRLH